MEKSSRTKLILVGVVLILAGIVAFVYNFVFSELISLYTIPATALLMIFVGIMFIRRALAKY